ncbi:MAG: hypothetical protein H6797_00830 [Candidatus Nomurabacteria bacterium]|nr:MAG: hypothetical protein H6797_00830 [Candidatus Nomurabacteria bacterium]
MARLPTPGGDSGNWGTILNTFLSQVHASDGTLKTDSVTSDAIAPNAVTSSALAPNAVDAITIADGSITETLLDTAVQTKLNATAPVTSVASKTGDVSLTKTDVGLDQVDNTSDATKNSATATLTNKTLTGPTIDSPSLIGNITGAASIGVVAGSVSGLYLSATTGVGTLGAVRVLSSTGANGLAQLGVNGNQTASSGTQFGIAITSNINQSSTAGYTALLVNPTETATGSGTKRLIDAQVGGTSKFVVDNAGNVTLGSTTIAAGPTPLNVSLGGSYGNSTAGSSNNMKLALYNDSSVKLGFGVSLNTLEYQVNSLSSHKFYVGGTERLAISSSSMTVGGVPVVTTSDTQTLTNKTLTSPTFTGTITGVADATTTGSGKVVTGGVLSTQPDANSTSMLAIPGLYNDLSYCLMRAGASMTITKNGGATVAGVDYLYPDAMFAPQGMTYLNGLVNGDVFVIEVTAPSGLTMDYVNTYGISCSNSFRASNVTIEVYFNGAWTSIHSVTNQTAGDVWKFYSSGAYSVTKIRYTLTNFPYNQCRIFSLYAITGTTALASGPLLPRTGGALYGTNAAPPTLTATGADASINLNLVPKGSGTVQANGVEVATISGTQTLTNKTLTSPTLTTPRTASIMDTNGNWAFMINATTNAINYLQVINSATGSAVRINAAGSDTNISMNLVPKGTGVIQANGAEVATTTGTQTLSNKTLVSPTITGTPTGVARQAQVDVFTPLGANYVTDKQVSSNVVTLTTLTAHGYQVGDKVWINGIDSAIELNLVTSVTITSIPTATTFTFARSVADIAPATVRPYGNVFQLQTWTKPSGAVSVKFTLCGPGGGGGSGARRATTSNRTGGGGGGGGGWQEVTVPASDVPDTAMFVSVPAGAYGGLPVTTDDTDGMVGGRSYHSTRVSNLEISYLSTLNFNANPGYGGLGGSTGTTVAGGGGAVNTQFAVPVERATLATGA